MSELVIATRERQTDVLTAILTIVIPFVDSDDKNEKTDVSSSLASTMPMMAVSFN